jgi:hypothetical protein
MYIYASEVTPSSTVDGIQNLDCKSQFSKLNSATEPAHPPTLGPLFKRLLARLQKITARQRILTP